MAGVCRGGDKAGIDQVLALPTLAPVIAVNIRRRVIPKGWYGVCMERGLSSQTPNPTMQHDAPGTETGQEIQRLKARIAQVWARRESLKQALADGAMRPSQGLRELEAVDRELAGLDTRFKLLWDRAKDTAKASL
jgi:hypothetical protein